MTKQRTLPVRGFLLHITHYDPVWAANKETEKPFDLHVGLELIDAMAEAGLNLLGIDCADGLKYESHPELSRHYSVPMSALRELVERAVAHEIEVMPKLNFAQSALHQHNHWFRPHNRLFDSEEYWQLAFELIDEILDVVKPPRFFHVGMDEDHWRSYRQYVEAIKTLQSGLKERGVRAVIWNDSACAWPAAEIHGEKSLAAEKDISRDVVQALWDYGGVKLDILRRIRQEGFELWGAPGSGPERVEKMRDALSDCGGSGILLTCWRPCVQENRDAMLNLIRTCGPVCCQS